MFEQKSDKPGTFGKQKKADAFLNLTVVAGSGKEYPLKSGAALYMDEGLDAKLIQMHEAAVAAGAQPNDYLEVTIKVRVHKVKAALSADDIDLS